MPLTQESWTRLEYETPQHYHYFCIYRDLGPQRSMRKAYLHQLPRWRYTQFGRKRYSRLLSGRWIEISRRNRWYQRALDFDRHLGVGRIPTTALRMLDEFLGRYPVSHKRSQIISLD